MHTLTDDELQTLLDLSYEHLELDQDAIKDMDDDEERQACQDTHDRNQRVVSRIRNRAKLTHLVNNYIEQAEEAEDPDTWDDPSSDRQEDLRLYLNALTRD